MRGVLTPVLAVVLGLTTVSWGLCPCALSKALRTVTKGPVPAAQAPCCPRCRSTRPAEAPPEKGRAPADRDCPHCGASTRGAAVPAPSASPIPLPVLAELVVLPVPATLPETAAFRSAREFAPPPLGPPDGHVGTVVLRL